MDNYILKDDHTVVPCNDLLLWASWFETAERSVGNTQINKIRISTVFLGIDHNFGDGDPTPVLFETMIFGGEHDDYQERYTTWDAAIAGHKKAIAKVKADE